MPDDLRTLVGRCLKGDQTAMAELVGRFQRQVYGLCLRMVSSHQDAEDLTQETFVRALKNLAKWDPQREFRPWLFAIAGNRCRSLLATRLKRPPRTSLVEEIADPSPDRETRRQTMEEINLALQKLRTEYREAFLLFHQQELSYAEISEVLDCPVGTVKTWIHRARGELARHLKRRMAEEASHELPKV